MAQLIKFRWDKQIGPIVSLQIFNKQFAFCACHRLPERSIKFFGLEKFFCSRCLGILFGGFIGFLFIIFNFHIPISYAIILMIPLIVDGLTQAAGMRESSNLLRLVTGLLFGFALMGVKF
jgi:uncharacterized membrane protein